VEGRTATVWPKSHFLNAQFINFLSVYLIYVFSNQFMNTLVKVKLSSCLINQATRHEDVWGSGGISPFLTRELDEGEWSVSHPGVRWIGDWVGLRAVLDAAENRKISFPCRESNAGCPACSPSLYRLSYPSSREKGWRFILLTSKVGVMLYQNEPKCTSLDW
jgi:hypothetical protein